MSVLDFLQSCSSELNCASCARNSPSACGSSGFWCCSCVTSSCRNASRPSASVCASASCAGRRRSSSGRRCRPRDLSSIVNRRRSVLVHVAAPARESRARSRQLVDRLQLLRAAARPGYRRHARSRSRSSARRRCRASLPDALGRAATAVARASSTLARAGVDTSLQPDNPIPVPARARRRRSPTLQVDERLLRRAVALARAAVDARPSASRKRGLGARRTRAAAASPAAAAARAPPPRESGTVAMRSERRQSA